MTRLIKKLKQLEETTLLDLLGVTSEDLVDAFLDIIKEREEYLYGVLEEEFEAED